MQNNKKFKNSKYYQYIFEVVEFYAKLIKYLFIGFIVFTGSLCNFYLQALYLPSLVLAHPIINRRLEFKQENQACLKYIIRKKGQPGLDGLYIPFATGVIIASVSVGHTPDYPNNYLVTVQKFGWFGIPSGYSVIDCTEHVILN